MRNFKGAPYLMVIVCLICSSAFSQNVSISDDGSAALPSAMLEIRVAAPNKKGLLIPRMTSAERIAISSPAKGLLVYDSTSRNFWFHNGTAWTQLSSGLPNSWQINGININNNNSGNVGVGVSTPKAKFHVAANKTVLFGADSLSSVEGAQFVWFAKKGAVRFRTQNTGSYPEPMPYNYAAIGENSLAIGEAVASGQYSFSIGNSASASGNNSFAQGFGASAPGNGSFSRGAYTASVGESSYAGGFTTLSTGTYSFTHGDYLEATAMNCFVIGSNNDPIAGSSASQWVTKDPLFIIGNGGLGGFPSNALVVLKNGVIGIGKNPVGDNASWGMMQLTNVSGKDLLTFVQKTTTNRWGMFVPDAGTAELFLKYNGVSKGKFSTVNGAYTLVSDKRLKKDVSPLNEVLARIMQLRPYKYHYLDNQDNDPLSYGFFAQDVAELFPSFVSQVSYDGGEERLGIDYNNFSVIGIKAIQEQQLIIQKQNLIISDQQQRINDLEKRMQAIEQLMVPAKTDL